jgi:hypothetical protein
MKRLWSKAGEGAILAHQSAGQPARGNTDAKFNTPADGPLASAWADQ